MSRKLLGRRKTGWTEVKAHFFPKGTFTKSRAGRRRGTYGRHAYTSKESKFFNRTQARAVTTTGGQFFNLALVAQGTDENERIGRRITITQIDVRLIIDLPTTTSLVLGSDDVKIQIIQDKQANKAIAAITDYVDTANILSFRALPNSGRFRTLATNQTNINQTGGGDGTTSASYLICKYVSLHWQGKLVMEFNGTAGVITNVNSTNIILYIISENGSAFQRFEARIRFTG